MKIKNRILALILTAAAVCPISAYSDEAPPETSAYAFCLYCANNGEILLEKNSSERLPPASTTKLMTALLGFEAVQNGDIDVTITPEMYAEGSSMYLADGETVKLSQLVGGMLMVSGNDAANAIAATLGGSAEGFAYMMNDKAVSLSMADTHFVTPSGLDAQGHFSSARDLAKLMAACMENPLFAEVDKSACVTVDFVEPQGKTETYYNENKLLSMYEYCAAGKTGYTDKAGRTLVTCAEKDGVRLIAATLNDGDDWNDHIRLYEYGFSVVTMEKPKNAPDSTGISLPVVGGTGDSVTVVCGEPPLVCSDVTVETQLPHFLYAPVSKGEKIGRALYYTGGVYAGCADITAADDVAADKTQTAFTDNIVSFFKRRKEKWKKR